jgi:hypothetical protein
MGSLLPRRTQVQKQYNVNGVDYAGPTMYDSSSDKARKQLPQKAYVAIFISMTSDAIHLELANNASTQQFIGTLTPFISRRGRPTHIYSDNAANFVQVA